MRKIIKPMLKAVVGAIILVVVINCITAGVSAETASEICFGWDGYGSGDYPDWFWEMMEIAQGKYGISPAEYIDIIHQMIDDTIKPPITRRRAAIDGTVDPADFLDQWNSLSPYFNQSRPFAVPLL